MLHVGVLHKKREIELWSKGGIKEEDTNKS